MSGKLVQPQDVGARLVIKHAGLGKHPDVTLDGLSLNHCLQAYEIEWSDGEFVAVATLQVRLQEVDLDALTLVHLIGRTASPATIEEAIRSLKKLKAEL
jgi:hypothetical protein